MAENFLNCDEKYLLTDTRSSQTLKMSSMKKTTLRYILMKAPKINKEKNCEQTKGRKKTHYVGRNRIRMAADFSVERVEAGRWWNNIFKTLKNSQLRILCSVKNKYSNMKGRGRPWWSSS